MQFPETSWFQSHKRRSNRLRHREIGRINLIKDAPATRDRFGLVLKCMIDIRAVASQFAITARHIARAGGAV